jgi:multidrug efflux pump subunit AcrA (membrane-fusion protein)
MNRAQLQAQLLNQGFQQAQQAAAADLAAQQGLGTYQSQLGQQQQAVAQAQLDAAQIAAREKEFQPFTQLGLIGQQLAQIQPGAFPTQTVGYAPPAAPASPMSQFLGGAAGIAGIGGKLGLFG